jgi:hypothetical protein
LGFQPTDVVVGVFVRGVAFGLRCLRCGVVFGYALVVVAAPAAVLLFVEPYQPDSQE